MRTVSCVTVFDLEGNVERGEDVMVSVDGSSLQLTTWKGKRTNYVRAEEPSWGCKNLEPAGRFRR